MNKYQISDCFNSSIIFVFFSISNLILIVDSDWFIQMQKLQQYEKEEDEIDSVLTTLGLRRKRIPKDGSCLFR